MNEHSAYFEQVLESCIDCGLCTKVQEECGCYAQTYADFSRALLDAMDRNDYNEVTYAVWSCTLCGACTARCPADIDAYEFVHHARCMLNPVQTSIVEQFAPMRTNLQTNVLQQLCEHHRELLPEEAGEGVCETLFFPGCALSAYAPELTSAVYEHLRSTGSVDGIVYGCCGSPFYFMGDERLLDARARELARFCAEHGVQAIITACASCQAALDNYQRTGILPESLTITPLPVILAQQELTVDVHALQRAGYSSISIKDVCRDRAGNVFGSSVRQILRSCEVVELEHACRNSRCCGSGGLVSLFDEEVSDDKRWAVLSEFDDTGASCLVTMCVNCSIALRQDGDTNIVHYLELLFDKPIDWAAVSREMQAVLASEEERR